MKRSSFRMGSTVSLGRLFGITFRLHFSWFIIFLLLTVSLVHPHYSEWLYWVIGVGATLLFFASVVGHEVSHSLVGRANGIPIGSITLFIFGGFAEMTREVDRPSGEMKMALAGPVFSLAAAGAFALAWVSLPRVAMPVSAMLFWLAAMNGGLAVFNLIPGFPLDGGRVLRSLLWRYTGNYFRATRIATVIGQGIGYLFIAGGAVIVFLRPSGVFWFNGIWTMLIGWFLARAALASYHQARWHRLTVPADGESKAGPSGCPVLPR